MITGRSKFAQWVNPTAPSPFSMYDVKRVGLCGFTTEDILLGVLEGDYNNLKDAFIWSTTPQGHRYWVEKRDGRVPMSEEDYAFVEAVWQYKYGDR